MATPVDIIDFPAPTQEAERQVTKYEEQATELETRVASFPVKNEADYQTGLAFVGQIKSVAKELEADRKSITDPINKSLKLINAKYKGPKDVLEKAQRALEAKLGAYYAEQQRKAREAEAKALAAQQAKQEKLNERASELGVAPAMAAPVAPRVAEPAKSVATAGGGSVGLKPVSKWRLVDAALVPREYLMLDEVKIGKVTRAGVDIPGIERYEEYVSVGRGV